MIPDKTLVAARFAKAAGTYDAEAVVQHRVARRLAELIHGQLGGPVRDILEVGCGTGFLSRLLNASLGPKRMRLNDICPGMRERLGDLLGGGTSFMAGDAETCRLGSGFDLVASSSVMQWFANPESFFSRCAEMLTPCGCLAFSTYGPKNMEQIAELTGIGLSYRSLPEWVALFGRRWRVAVAIEETVESIFPTPMDVLRHLRLTGVTGVCRRQWTARALRTFDREYLRRHSRGDGVALTYHPVYIVAMKLGADDPRRVS